MRVCVVRQRGAGTAKPPSLGASDSSPGSTWHAQQVGHPPCLLRLHRSRLPETEPHRIHPSPQRQQGNAGGHSGWGADSTRLRFGLAWDGVACGRSIKAPGGSRGTPGGKLVPRAMRIREEPNEPVSPDFRPGLVVKRVAVSYTRQPPRRRTPYLLNRKWQMSPSRITYSFPSTRSLPAARMSFSVL